MNGLQFASINTMLLCIIFLLGSILREVRK